MLAKDLMRTDVITIGENDTIEALIDVLVREHIHGLPVVGAGGRLVGVVTQQDVFFAKVTRGEPVAAGGGAASGAALRVRDIMTAPAVSADEETDALLLCEMMTRLRIHRLPIVREGKVRGIVSSLDICAALAQGRLKI